MEWKTKEDKKRANKGNLSPTSLSHTHFSFSFSLSLYPFQASHPLGETARRQLQLLTHQLQLLAHQLQLLSHCPLSCSPTFSSTNLISQCLIAQSCSPLAQFRCNFICSLVVVEHFAGLY